MAAPKSLTVRISVDVTPDQSYNALTHASVALTMKPETSLADLIASARTDVDNMLTSAVHTSTVASAIADMKEDADAHQVRVDEREASA
jgi:hypothetical protein